MPTSSPHRLLIPTKLHAPFMAADTLHRGRLHAMLNVNPHERILWVSAPGGSGKTVAVGDFVSRLASPVGWYSLDESDNEPTVFFAYLLSTCQQFFDSHDLLEPILNGQGAQVESLIAELITRFTHYPETAILIFDDWHVITNNVIQLALQTLVEHSPVNLKLMILSRHRCPWPNRQQAIVRQWLRELTAGDLAFTNDESQQLFRQDTPLALLHKLVAQLDGWAAGLKMVALSNAGVSVSNTRLLKGQFNFNDYFKAEVFDSLPNDLQSSLIRSSVVERFDLDLLQALNLEMDAERFISELIKRQLFTVQLDDENQWFRFHHLFSEFLSGLRQQCPELSSECYALATGHCLQAGLDQEALTYALHCQQPAILEQAVLSAGKRLELAGYYRLLIQAYDTLTGEALIQNFELALFFAWFRFKIQSHPPMDVGLFIEQSYIALIAPTAIQTQQYYSIRCNLAFESEQIDEANRFFKKIHLITADDTTAEHLALPYSEKQDKVYLLSLAAELARNKGNLTQAIAYHEMEQQLAKKLGTQPSTWNIHQLASIYHCQGQLQRAKQWFDYGLELNYKTGAHYSVSAWCTNVSMAEIQLDFLHYDKVTHYCQQAYKRANVYQNDDWRMVPCSIEVRSLLLNKQPATELASTLQSLMRSRRFHSHSKAQGDAALIQYWKSTDDRDSLAAWLSSESPVSFAEPVNRLPDYLCRLNVYRVYWYLAKLKQSDLPDGLLAYLQRDVIHSRQASFHFVSAQLQMVSSGWLLCAGKTSEAIAQLNLAFSAFHSFKSVGTALEDFDSFHDTIDNHALTEFTPEATQLVERLRLLLKQEHKSSLPEAARAIPLSAKEWQVLQNIGTNKTNAQIANEMFISEGTVKSHINRIYRKIGVSNRQQAVAVLLGINRA